MPDPNIIVPDTLLADVEEFASRYYLMVTDTHESRESSIGWLGPVIEWTEETAKEYGWEYLDDGGARFIVKIPSTACAAFDGPPLVLKLPIYRDDPRDGRYQNVCEANLWAEAPDELRPYLVPVLASGQLYRWLLMPYAETGPVDRELIEQRSQELVHDLGIPTNEVVAAQNWGVWNGEPRLIDYGHEVSQFVLDDGVQVSVEDYAPEIPASYEDDETDDGDVDGEDSDGESQEETVDGPDAEQVVLNGTGLLPAEKREIRGTVAGYAASAGETIEVDEFNIEVVETIPSTDSAFGVDVTLITDETRIRFD